MKVTKREKIWVQERIQKNQKRNIENYLGIHIIAEFWYAKIIDDEKRIKKILVEAVKRSKSIPLEIAIHKFHPQGITGVIILAESHIALHAWPEYNYLAVDIFTCGKETTPFKALEYLKKEFKPKEVEVKVVKRGKINHKNI